MTVMKPGTKKALYVAAAAAALVLLALAGWALSRPGPELLQGEVEATKVDVSSRIPGRVGRLLVKEGDRVKRGDPIATVETPEIAARLDQALAAKDAAAAQSDKADRGAREEEIRAARSAWERARSAAALAEKSFGRLDRLTRDGVVPAQRRDEAEAALEMARQGEAAAKAAWDMATTGTRREDKAAAKAGVARARGAIAEVEATLGEAKVTAPAAGEVYRRNVEPGEIVPAGFPLVTLVDLADSWVTFQLREDRLEGFAMGRTVTARFPALGNREVPLTVTYVAAEGDFATWRATSAQGGFDLRTFEVRARPAAPVEGLRPGMSAVVAKAPAR